MNTARLLAELSASLDVPSLQLDMDGACAMRFDDGLQVDLRFIESEDLLCLCAPLGMVLVARKTTLMTSMLLANLTLGENGKPCLALEPGTGRVALSHTIAAPHASGVELASLLGHFASACRQTRDTFLQDGLITA